MARLVVEEGLPHGDMSLGQWTISGALRPAFHVGGDCFNCLINEDILCFLLLDAVGHGVGSALLAASPVRLAAGVHGVGIPHHFEIGPDGLSQMQEAIPAPMGLFTGETGFPAKEARTGAPKDFQRQILALQMLTELPLNNTVGRFQLNHVASSSKIILRGC
ncbi:hypothetical protein JST97_09310 [bacterium]|nr:hypothetical protein [bacterium]